MYEQDKTTNTWDCINAIPNSSPEKAIINASGNKPSMKKINPEFIILYVNPLSIFNSIWPLKILAANLNPKDTLRARYDRLCFFDLLNTSTNFNVFSIK